MIGCEFGLMDLISGAGGTEVLQTDRQTTLGKNRMDSSWFQRETLGDINNHKYQDWHKFQIIPGLFYFDIFCLTATQAAKQSNSFFGGLATHWPRLQASKDSGRPRPWSSCCGLVLELPWQKVQHPPYVFFAKVECHYERDYERDMYLY